MRFCSFSKKARFNRAYSSSVQTSRHLGSNDFVTSKHSMSFSQGKLSHIAQF